LLEIEIGKTGQRKTKGRNEHSQMYGGVDCGVKLRSLCRTVSNQKVALTRLVLLIFFHAPVLAPDTIF
jgi:hypothetical protein